MPEAGKGDFPFDYRGVAVANNGVVSVCGRSTAAYAAVLALAAVARAVMTDDDREPVAELAAQLYVRFVAAASTEVAEA